MGKSKIKSINRPRRAGVGRAELVSVAETPAALSSCCWKSDGTTARARREPYCPSKGRGVWHQGWHSAIPATLAGQKVSKFGSCHALTIHFVLVPRVQTCVLLRIAFARRMGKAAARLWAHTSFSQGCTESEPLQTALLCR